MKKVFIIRLIVLLALLVSLPVSAYDFKYGDIYYNISGDEVYVTSGDSKYQGSIVIPSQVTYNGKTYRVTSIGDNSFEQCSGLTSISIPNSVASIHSRAFSDCTSLSSIKIPDGVKYIFYRAFSGCNSLTTITIPKSIIKIFEDAFYGCTGLSSVYISDLEAWCKIDFETSPPLNNYTSNPLYYAHHLLLNGEEISNLVIPNTVIEIGHGVFDGCINLTSVTISSSVTSIGSSAFKDCSNLISITIPNSVTSIGNNAFSGTAWYNNQPDGLVYAGKIAYKFKGEMPTNTSIVLEDGTMAVAPYAFNNCSGLISITIPNSVTFIGHCVFLDCSNLASITIPNTVTSIGSDAFSGTAWYNNQPDGLVYAGKIAYKFKGEMPANMSVLIKEGTSKIANYAFNNCSNLISVTIPNTVTEIGNYAFYECNNLASVTIPSSVSHVGDRAFSGTEWYKNQPDGLVYAGKVAYKYKGEMPAYTSIIINDGTIGITGAAFYYCKGLTSVTIPRSVISIGNDAFGSCSGLTSIVSEIEKPFVIDASVFNSYDVDIYISATLTVPKGTKALYQATEGWNKFTKITEAGDKDEVTFAIDGISYQGSESEKTVVVKSVDASRTWLEIPASVSYDGITYQVTGIDNDVFKGSSMAALIWDVEAVLPNNAFSNASIGSNFLLYVKSSSYAPSSVKNVVVNGMAQTIVLSDDGGQFYCPQAFAARNISYTHNYSMETDIGKAKGWETLALPFDVQKISHNTRGEIVPFPSYNSSSIQKPFWLANFSGNGFRRTAAVLANEPYIIAMPNSSSYRNEYNLAGDVTFSADNVQVPKTPSFSGTFVPAFATVAKSSSVYALNVDNRNVKYSGSYDVGSRFIANLRDVRPFEAYISSSSSTRGIYEIHFDDGTTDMLDILLPTDESQEVTIHTLSGQQVSRTTQLDFDAVWQQLPKGVYIVNGMKWIK